MESACIIPALRFDALTRFFDPVVRVTTRERRFKQLLVDQVNLQPGHRVVDVGCGTGTLAMQLKHACPEAHVIGLDADPKVLELARAKIGTLNIEIQQGLAWEIPVEDQRVDRIVSSLVFHHLDRDAKLRTLHAMHRALGPDGELHIADWGQAHGLGMRLAFVTVQLLDGFGTTADSVAGRLPALIAEAGFRDVLETQRLRTPLGTISLYRARL